MSAYDYATNGRNWTTLITLICLWAAIILLVLLIDMSPVIAWVFFALTLPALYDLVSARAAGLHLDDTTLHWYAGKSSGDVALRKIKHIRFDTRLDLSVRVTLVLYVGPKVKIPFEATPPHRAFEDELQARGIKTERHHFGFI